MDANEMPTWDLTERMTLDAQYGGIYVGTTTLEGVIARGDPTGFPEAYNNLVFRIPLHTANAMCARIRRFQFAGAATMYVNGDPHEPAWSGSWSVTVSASRYWRTGGAPLLSEQELCRFAGWHGTGNLTGTPTDADPVSSDMALWFGAGWFPPGFTDENGVVNASGQREVTFHTPAIVGGDTGTAYGFSFGKFVTDIDGNDIDNCPVITTLPITKNGSFDGSGCTSFRMELGGSDDGALIPASSANIIGSATLNPVLWWAHDPGDGLGPKWDVATGAPLR